MKKILKSIAFLSFTIYLTMNTNVAYAGDCNSRRTSYEFGKMYIYLSDKEIGDAYYDKFHQKERSLEKRILAILRLPSYSVVANMPFRLTRYMLQDWNSISKKNGNCGAKLEFSCEKNSKGKEDCTSYIRALSQK